MKAIIAIAAGLCLAAALNAQDRTPPAAGFVEPAARDAAAIKVRLAALDGLRSGAPYAEKPSFRPPLRPGRLNDAYLGQGLATVNCARWLAGLDEDVPADPAWNDIAQHGAVLLRVLGRLDHTPALPAGSGMSKDFYDRAYQGTSTSNLHQGVGNLGEAVRGFLDDSDQSNIDRLGHRRWVLYPRLAKVGFGFADGFAALKVFGPGADEAKPNRRAAWVAWPAAGLMPVSWFERGQAWSFSVDPEAYGGKLAVAKTGVRVYLRRLRDDRVWRFGPEKSDGYYNLERSGFGLPFCVVFRPDGMEGYRGGDQFEVSVAGVQDGAGKDLAFRWTTAFLSVGPAVGLPGLTGPASKRPAALTLQASFKSKGWDKQAVELDKRQGTFGYVGVPLEGFSWSLDGADGLQPIGFQVNGGPRVYGPGEWVDCPGGLTSLTVVGDVRLKYTVYTKAKGWAPWVGTGTPAGFGDGEAIEVVSILIN